MNKAHGSPFDRGSADSYYRRSPRPHWYPNGTGKGVRIEHWDMIPEQIAEYRAGWEENEKDDIHKEWD
jgi:hypothetical protein